MQTILLAIDFSEGVENCCNYAVRVAHRFEAEIILFHSYFDKFSIAEGNFPTGLEIDTLINRKILQDIKSQAEADLENIRSCIIEAFPGTKVKSELMGGNPEDEIINAADTYKVDLVILGSSNKAAKGIFSGSISKKIMNNTNVPVLSIPLDYTYKNITQVLYPTEFLHDKENIKNIYNLLSKFDIKIHCLHLSQDAKSGGIQTFETLKSEFSTEISEDLLSIKVIESDNYVESIHEYIKEHRIDLITFIAHKRGFLKEFFTQKLTKKDLFQLRLPMLALKR